MITGDSELTAACVSQKLSLGPEKPLFLEIEGGDQLAWFDEDNKKVQELNAHKIDLAKDHTLCLTGSVLKHLETKRSLQEIKEVIRNITVFARVSPSQKEYIVYILKTLGEKVLMCGDGTNDVGALKKSDCGLALVGLNDLKEKTPEEKKKAKELKKRKSMMAPPEDLFGDGPSYKPGDASIAAPFTSKHSNSTICVPIVLKQGVCTLVTTFQTYKILAMTCLISAYSMSALHMQKTKFSETQSTIMGILGAMNYYYYSNAKPLKVLSHVKPPTTIFEPYFIFSVAGQVLNQLYFMNVVVQDIGLKYSSPEELKLINDEEFKPTFLNTVVFLHSIIAQTIIFLFNYGGKPFMESLSENKKYFKILCFTLIGSLLLAGNGSDDLNYHFDLSFYQVPNEAVVMLVKNLGMMVVINYVYEKTLKFLKFRNFFDFI